MRFGIAAIIGGFVFGLWVSPSAFGDGMKQVNVTDDKLA
jgi:hypothetical protein